MEFEIILWVFWWLFIIIMGYRLIWAIFDSYDSFMGAKYILMRLMEVPFGLLFIQFHYVSSTTHHLLRWKCIYLDLYSNRGQIRDVRPASLHPALATCSTSDPTPLSQCTLNQSQYLVPPMASASVDLVVFFQTYQSLQSLRILNQNHHHHLFHNDHHLHQNSHYYASTTT